MTGLIMAAQLILGLAILVTLHEFGHFMAARIFGIRVEKFYLFFDAWGVKLFSFTRGDTEYGIGWLPLGGYVKISGMIDESLDKEQLKHSPEPWEFRSKPAWQRLIVMIAGVAMNVILGITIYSGRLYLNAKEFLPNVEVKNGIYAYKYGKEIGLENGDKIIAIDGKPFMRFEDLLSTRILFGATLTVDRNGQKIEVKVPDDFYRTASKNQKWDFIGAGDMVFKVSTIDSTMPAAKAGLKGGDKIMLIDGNKLLSTEDFRNYVQTNKGKTIRLTLERDGKTFDIPCEVNDKGIIGIAYEGTSDTPKDYKKMKYTAGSALHFGASDAMEAITSTIKGLKLVITGREKATESIQGPIGIAKFYGGQWDWSHFWGITGLLSMVLAFMNILPIPALDGGHVIFLAIEAITQRKFSDKFMERSQVVGMVILLALMVFALGNDVWRHVLN